MSRWRGPKPRPREEQIVNAPDGLFALAPVSGVPAARVRSNWAALLPDHDTPLIWERTDA